ncbi:MAG: mechanosensitive ion channel [bacterium]|nr:mechanosensitive ion channel [bacterium]
MAWLTKPQCLVEPRADVLDNPEPEVLLSGFGDSSWNMILRAWVAHPKRHYITRSEINCAIVRKFRESNVEIPFPQRDLHVKSLNDSWLK